MAHSQQKRLFNKSSTSSGQDTTQPQPNPSSSSSEPVKFSFRDTGQDKTQPQPQPQPNLPSSSSSFVSQPVKFSFRDNIQENNNNSKAALFHRFTESGIDRLNENKTKTTPLSSSSRFNIAENRPVAKNVQPKTPSRNFGTPFSHHPYLLAPGYENLEENRNPSTVAVSQDRGVQYLEEELQEAADENSPLNKSFYVKSEESIGWQNTLRSTTMADQIKLKTCGQRQHITKAVQKVIEKTPIKHQHTTQTRRQAQEKPKDPKAFLGTKLLNETAGATSREKVPPSEDSFDETTSENTRRIREPDDGNFLRIRKDLASPSSYHKLSPRSRRAEEAANEHIIRSFPESSFPKRGNENPAPKTLEGLTDFTATWERPRTMTPDSNAEQKVEQGRGREDIISSSEDRSSGEKEPRNQDTSILTSVASPIRPIEILDSEDEPVATTTQPYVKSEKQALETDSTAIKDTANPPAISGTLQIHENSKAEKTAPVSINIIQPFPILETNKIHAIETMPPEPPVIHSPDQPMHPPEHIASVETTIPIPAAIHPNQIHPTCEITDVPVPPKHQKVVNQPPTINHFNDENEYQETQIHGPVNNTQEAERPSTGINPINCTDESNQILLQRSGQDIHQAKYKYHPIEMPMPMSKPQMNLSSVQPSLHSNDVQAKNLLYHNFLSNNAKPSNENNDFIQDTHTNISNDHDSESKYQDQNVQDLPIDTQNNSTFSDDTFEFNNRTDIQHQTDLMDIDEEKEALLNEAFENDEIYDVDYDAYPICPNPGPKKAPQDAHQWSDICPVAGCGASFKTEVGLHIHTNKHISRDPNTVVSSHYFNIYKRISCLQCRVTLPTSSAVHGMHPKCANKMQQPHYLQPEIELDFKSQPVDLDQWSFPNPEEVAHYPAKIISRIPKAARSHFASIASVTLLDIAMRNNKEAWSKWMVMIRSILWDPGRGGKAHINNKTKIIMNRIKLWRDQSFAQLWNNYLKHSSDIFNAPKKASTNSNKHNDTIARNKRCIKYAAIGELSKAFKSLSPSPATQYNDAVITALRNKHPDEAPPIDIVTSFEDNKNPNLPPIPIHKHITIEELTKYISKLSRSSSGGIDLFTAQHLIDLEPYQNESSTLTNWAKVAQLIIEGRACADAQAIAYGARLIAIPKPDNTPRPIAVGSLLRRSAGAILLQRHSEQISKTLGPKQLGVNVKQGAEIFSHGFKAISKHIQTNNKGVLVKIDFQNAFNTCKRRKLLELVRKQIPELYGYARGCYAKHAPLFLPTGHIITSKTGVHQGDPLGGTFFAIAAYHDDLALAADNPQHVIQAVTSLLTTTDTHGTKINLDKCEWLSNIDSPPPTHLKQIPHNQTFNTTIVGIPTGDENYVQKEMSIILKEWNIQFDNLLSLKHAQTMLLLLRNSLNATKANYHMRANFLKSAHNWTTQFDEKMKSTTESILACPLTNCQWLQCQMPIRRGGLGLNSANVISSPAYIASSLTASQRLPNIHPNIQNVDWSSPNEFEAAISHYNNNTQPHNNIIDCAFIPNQAKLSKNILSRIQGELRDKMSTEHRTL
ncbi:hypothetical protein RFI_02897, partial [Reticulomyxa filosa]